MTSTRQANGSSCGLFVLLVVIIYIYRLSIVLTFKVCSILSVNTVSAFVHCLQNATCLTSAIDIDRVTNRHTAAMRRFALKQLLDAATVPPRCREVCDALQCVNTDKDSTWVCCDVCGRWCHLICVNVNHQHSNWSCYMPSLLHEADR